MKIITILFTLLSFNLLAIHFNSLNIGLKLKIKSELKQKIKNFKIERYRLPALKGIKNIKEIKKIEFLGNKLLGSTALVIKTDKKKFYGSVVISRKIKHLYARREIKKNEIFSKDDFEEVEVFQTIKSYHNAIKSFKEIKGKVAKSRIKPYKKLYSHQFEAPYIIKKGEDVIIKARHGKLTLSTRGIARERGKLGKYIMVKTMFNNKILRAKIVASKKVEVFIGE